MARALLSAKQWIQLALFVAGITLTGVIARTGGGLWIFVGWAVGCTVFMAPSLMEARERGRLGVTIVITLAAALLGGTVDYMFRTF